MQTWNQQTLLYLNDELCKWQLDPFISPWHEQETDCLGQIMDDVKIENKNIVK